MTIGNRKILDSKKKNPRNYLILFCLNLHEILSYSSLKMCIRIDTYSYCIYLSICFYMSVVRALINISPSSHTEKSIYSWIRLVSCLQYQSSDKHWIYVFNDRIQIFHFHLPCHVRVHLKHTHTPHTCLCALHLWPVPLHLILLIGFDDWLSDTHGANDSARDHPKFSLSATM